MKEPRGFESLEVRGRVSKGGEFRKEQVKFRRLESTLRTRSGQMAIHLSAAKGRSLHHQ